MRILITGASGFIGTNACIYLSSIGHEILAFSRSSFEFSKNIKCIKGVSLSSSFSTPKSLDNIHCVIHLAGKAHISNKKIFSGGKNEFDYDVKETLNLASMCSKANVRRFIFISSAKVNGEFTLNNNSFSEHSLPNPCDQYAISKYKTEVGLFKIAQNTNMEIVIIRPPLLYGIGVKGYFKTILKLVKNKIPLPFAALVKNKRSFIYLDNFLNFLNVVISHPKAANNIFLVSDQYDISSAYLLSNLYIGMHDRDYLFKFPNYLLSTSSKIIGKSRLYNKLKESFRLDTSKASSLLSWEPPHKLPNTLFEVSKNYILKN